MPGPLANPDSPMLSCRKFLSATIFSAGLLSGCAADVESVAIGLTASRSTIDAQYVAAANADAPTLVVLGGLDGGTASRTRIEAVADAWAALPDAERWANLYAIPVANPEASPLEFPPTGRAYSDNTESYALWRWLGLTGPASVYVIGADSAGLAAALSTGDVAGVAPVPARALDASADVLALLQTAVPPSPAQRELERRRSRTPLAFANELAPLYGQSFGMPIYTDGMALLAHLALGNTAHVEDLVAQYVDGTSNSLESRMGVSTLVLAGHLVFAALAEQTGDPRYLERARAAADLSFDANGNMLEAVPGHGEMSDAIFMGASILAAVGALTDEQRYFDMAVRQIDFMNTLVHRDDGLYRHSPLTDAAWGRGNGFAAIGYALTLSKLPPDHPGYTRLLGEYRSYMQTLADWQNEDGSWRQVIDYPGSYHETSSTAIIGFSMQRGLNLGLLDPAYEDNVRRAFDAVLTRTGPGGVFIDVSESTNKQQTLDAYLMREALYGQDNRTGSFAMLFAVERAAAGAD